jgi:hypothetical protein
VTPAPPPAPSSANLLGGEDPAPKQVGTSVTGFLQDLFPKFESHLVAQRMCASPGFPFQERHRSMYWNLPLFEGGRSLNDLHAERDCGENRGTTPVRQPCLPSPNETSWRGMRVPASAMVGAVTSAWCANALEASTLGTQLHRDCEAHYNGLHVENQTEEYQHFLAYTHAVRDQGWVAYRSEQCIYDEDADLAGCVDMQFARVEHMLLSPSARPNPLPIMLCDWKRSSKIQTTAYNGERGLHEAASLPNVNASKYCLQLATYQCLLERHYSVKVVQREFAVFHPSNASYVVYNVDKVSQLLLNSMAPLSKTHPDQTIDSIVESALARRVQHTARALA